MSSEVPRRQTSDVKLELFIGRAFFYFAFVILKNASLKLEIFFKGQWRVNFTADKAFWTFSSQRCLRQVDVKKAFHITCIHKDQQKRNFYFYCYFSFRQTGNEKRIITSWSQVPLRHWLRQRRKQQLPKNSRVEPSMDKLYVKRDGRWNEERCWWTVCACFCCM